VPSLLKTATVAGNSIKEINEKIEETVEEQVDRHGRKAIITALLFCTENYRYGTYSSA
jgi:hypothetical protein